MKFMIFAGLEMVFVIAITVIVLILLEMRADRRELKEAIEYYLRGHDKDWHEPQGHSCICGAWIKGGETCPSCRALAHESAEANRKY